MPVPCEKCGAVEGSKFLVALRCIDAPIGVPRDALGLPDVPLIALHAAYGECRYEAVLCTACAMPFYAAIGSGDDKCKPTR